jgi:hypothetical protein
MSYITHFFESAASEVLTAWVVKISIFWDITPIFWLQIQKSRVRFPALSDFLRSSGSGTGSTQPHENI